MDLWLFSVLMFVALVMITIGLSRPSESAQGLIGFFFLFLLGVILLNGNVEYKTGHDDLYVYGDNITEAHWDYSTVPAGPPQPTNEVYLFHIERTYTYTSYDGGFFFNFGYYLAIAGAVGFAGMLIGLRRTKWAEENN